MDTVPFLVIDLLNLNDTDIIELKKFQKESYDLDNIYNSATDLKYLNQIKKVLKDLFTNPNDDFIKLILNKDIYEGIKTQTIIDKYKPLVKKSINIYINDLINDRLQNAMKSNEEIEEEPIEIPTDKIETTLEEMESFYIIKSILSEHCELGKISYKDTLDYLGILYDKKTTKWICRVFLKKNVKYLTILNNDKEEKRYDIENLNDIYKYRKEIKDRLDSLVK